MKEKISKEAQVEDDPDSALKPHECFESDEKSQGKTKDIQTNITHPVWRGTWQEKGSNPTGRVRIKHKQTWKKQKKAFEKKKHEEYLPLKPHLLLGKAEIAIWRSTALQLCWVLLISNKAHDEITDEPWIHNTDGRNSAATARREIASKAEWGG